jgi:hypothetical protein
MDGTMNQRRLSLIAHVSLVALVVSFPGRPSGVAASTITFTATGTTLTPNRATNTVNIYAYDSIAEAYTALNFQMQIADGGLNNGIDTTQTGPLIGGMAAGTELTQGANSFSSGTSAAKPVDNNGNNNVSESQIWTYTGATSLATNTRTMPTSTSQSALTLVMTLNIDTTGSFSAGPWSLTVQGTYSGMVTDFVNNGVPLATVATTNFFPPVTLTVGGGASTPEPASLGLLGMIIPTMLLRRRRAR